jgi:hypothetical protein
MSKKKNETCFYFVLFLTLSCVKWVRIICTYFNNFYWELSKYFFYYYSCLFSPRSTLFNFQLHLTCSTQVSTLSNKLSSCDAEIDNSRIFIFRAEFSFNVFKAYFCIHFIFQLDTSHAKIKSEYRGWCNMFQETTRKKI